MSEPCGCGVIKDHYSTETWNKSAKQGDARLHWPARLGGCQQTGKIRCAVVKTADPVSSANPKQAYGAQKPALGLIPPVGLLHCAQAFEDGARKYGAFNWRTSGVESMTYIHAAMRHLQNYLDGEERASDSGVHNLGAVMACCAILLDAGSLGKLEDNRPPKGKSSETQDAMKAEKNPLPAGFTCVEPGCTNLWVSEGPYCKEHFGKARMPK